MNWTAEIVRARFVEAALVDSKMPAVKGLRQSWGRYLLQFVHSREDMLGWGGKRISEHRAEFWEEKRTVPDADEIGRAEEVIDWVARLIPDEDRRILVLNWATCKARGRDFGEWCRKNNRARSTANLHILQEMQRLASEFRRDRKALRLPSGFDVGHEPADSGSEDVMMDEVASQCFSRTEDAVPTIQPKDYGEFERWLKKTNASRRREQEHAEARRRAKLGITQTA